MWERDLIWVFFPIDTSTEITAPEDGGASIPMYAASSVYQLPEFWFPEAAFDNKTDI